MTPEQAKATAKKATQAFAVADAMFYGSSQNRAESSRPHYFRAFELRQSIESAGYEVTTDAKGVVSVATP